MKSGNSHINLAKQKKDDEFYTNLSDVEKELRHYDSDLVGKHIHMPCDNYRVSNFWRYFYENFHRLGLRKITAMHLARDGASSCLVSYDGGSIVTQQLSGDGSFMSDEGVAAISECDVVVTNPPFSLWRAFFKTLLDCRVEYIVCGTLNSFTTNVARPEFLSGRMSHGKGGRMTWFLRPDGSREELTNCIFYTNIRPFSHSSPHALKSMFNPEAHTKIDGLDAINCDRAADIPSDYHGVIAVPISYALKVCPEQFEIIGFVDDPVVGRVAKFTRLLIRNKHPVK